MKKSYNDIQAQAARIIEACKGTHHFQSCREGVIDAQAVWQMAARARAAHGISMFTTDRDARYEVRRITNG